MHAGAPVERWQKVRTKIHDEICSQAYNEKLGSFVQSYGSEQLDASLLLMPMTGFLPAEDPRVQGTLKAIEQQLMSGGLVLRYNTDKSSDGLPPGEGVFLACSFWMVSALQLQGRDADARKLFERVLSLANDVGLLAEEYDPGAKRLVGNFPQALSHIALVNAAFNLASPGVGAASPVEVACSCIQLEYRILALTRVGSTVLAAPKKKMTAGGMACTYLKSGLLEPVPWKSKLEIRNLPWHRKGRGWWSAEVARGRARHRLWVRDRWSGAGASRSAHAVAAERRAW